MHRGKLGVLCIFALVTGITYGDSLEHIAGSVYDASTRAPLVGVNIVVLDSDLGAASDERGRFVIYGVPVGSYSVEASMIGYRSQVKTNVVVEPGHTTELIYELTAALIEVGGVTARSDYFPKVKDAPVSERNFSSEEIQVQPGGIGDISRVVQTMPAVVSTGDQDNEIIVRGGSPNENLFLVDGIELPYPNHLNQRGEQGGGINLLNALTIREIDFIAGAFPVRYGDRASSVMNVTLRNGQQSRLGAKIDMGMSGLGFILEGPLPGNGSFIGSYHKSLLEIMVRSGVLRMDIVPEYTNYLGKIHYNLSRSDELSIVGIFAHDRAAAQPGEGIFDEDYAYDFRTLRFAGGVGWQRLYGDRGFGKLLLSGARTEWHNISQEVIDNRPGEILDSTHAFEQSWGIQYDATLQWSLRHETQLGVSAKWIPLSNIVYSRAETVYVYTYDDSTVVDSAPLLNDDATPVVQGPIDIDAAITSYKLAGYLQHRFLIDNIGHLTLGIRGDYFGHTGHQYLSPRVGFVTQPLLAGVSFIAGYGWHYQSPEYYILLMDSTANHFLESQRSDHYVLGLERLFSDQMKLTVEGYYKNIHHLHIPEHWTTPDPYDQGTAFLDIGNGSVYGIEVFLQRKFANNWHGTMSYSFSRARMDNPQDAARKIPADYDYRHVFTILGAYTIGFRKRQWYRDMSSWLKYSIGLLFLSDETCVGFRFRYMGGRPFTPLEWLPETRQWVENGDLINSDRLRDYHRFDFRLDHKYIFNSWSLTWYVEVQNVYDRKNLWWYNYKDDGTIEEIEQFRLFPVGGFEIEF